MRGKRGQPIITAQQPMMILDVLPPTLAARLDLRPKPIKRRLRRSYVWAATSLLLLIAAVFLIWHPWTTRVVRFPNTTASQVTGFVPYFFAGNVPEGFGVSQSSIDYSDGVLLFQLHNHAGNVIIVSEQPLPNQYVSPKNSASQIVAGAQGNGFVSSGNDRTVGVLVTSKNPQALISLTGGGWISVNAMKELVAQLRPVTK